MSTERDQDDRVRRDPETFRETLPTDSSDIEDARETIETLDDSPHHSTHTDADKSEIIGSPAEKSNQ